MDELKLPQKCNFVAHSAGCPHLYVHLSMLDWKKGNGAGSGGVGREEEIAEDGGKQALVKTEASSKV